MCIFAQNFCTHQVVVAADLREDPAEEMDIVTIIIISNSNTTYHNGQTLLSDGIMMDEAN